MNRLERLPDIAGQQLGGLQATEKMRREILRKAAEQEKPAKVYAWRPVLAMCAALVLCVGLATWTMESTSPDIGPTSSPLIIDSQPAGNGVGLRDGGGEPQAISAKAVSIEGAVDTPVYHSILEETRGGNFPMILLHNEAYRLLKTPADVSGSLLSDSVGEVTEYTLEPALSGGGVVSNVVSQGEPVFVVQGMEGAMIAANVDGAMRAFQRVSFAGTAVLGDERLADTLCSPENVASIELSGVGATHDAAKARELMKVLLDNAEYQSASVSSSGAQSLLIGLQNGLSLQLIVSEDSVSACGTWSCPEFFEAFAEAVK